MLLIGYPHSIQGHSALSIRERETRIEYLVTCVGDFAAQHAMTPAHAFAFLEKNGGIAFLTDCHDTEHSQLIQTAVDDMAEVRLGLHHASHRGILDDATPEESCPGNGDECDLFGEVVRKSAGRTSLSSNNNGFNAYFLLDDIRNGDTTIHSWDILERSLSFDCRDRPRDIPPKVHRGGLQDEAVSPRHKERGVPHSGLPARLRPAADTRTMDEAHRQQRVRPRNRATRPQHCGDGRFWRRMTRMLNESGKSEEPFCKMSPMEQTVPSDSGRWQAAAPAHWTE